MTEEPFGQFPPDEESIPPELRERLSPEDLDFYQKALRSRSFSYGLGALGYLRRVVENKTGELLDLIAEAAIEAGADAKELHERVEQAKKTFSFEDRVKLAAEILPQSMRPGGINPLGALHDLASSSFRRNDRLSKFVDPTETHLIIRPM